MNNKPQFSVVVIFFNEEKFLRDAVESIFAQTFENWELLLVDDGSTDASTGIARNYAEQYPQRVHYLKHEERRNRGASVSRNLGFRHAQGPYLALLDADDVWFPHKLQQQLDIMGSQPNVGMVYGASQWWSSWTGNVSDIQRDYVPELGVQPNTLFLPPALLTLFLNGQARVPCPSTIVFRREVIALTGGFEESFRRLYTDQSFYAKVCCTTPVFAAGECWSKYRQHPNSSVAIGKKTGEREVARLFYLDWLEGYLSSQGITDPALWDALKRKQFRHRNRILEGACGPGQAWLRHPAQAMKAFARRTLPVALYRWFRRS